MSILISVKVNKNVYLRDPLQTELGRNILKFGIILMEEIGFEAFNFKKLAKRMTSTEASIYRYFENKHYLLVYIASWYWDYLDYLLTINTRNLDDPKEKLKIAIETLVDAASADNNVEYIDQEKLHKLIVEESTKVYHIKNVDEENKVGLFKNYKNLSNTLASYINEINPEFRYPHAFATSMLEMMINHTYYAEHLPSLTEIQDNQTNNDELKEMLYYFSDRLLQP